MTEERKPRLLFVDDEELLLEAIRRVILRHRRADWDLSFETNPSTAITLQQHEPFDVVVTDLRMPEMDGITLAKHLHEIDPQTQIIMLSGTADLDTAMEVINDTPIFRFYTKPCPPEKLEEGIEDCLKRAAEKRASSGDVGFSVLDRMAVGVMVCDPDAHVVHMNQFAAQICASQDGLSVDGDNRLRCTYPAMRAQLKAALMQDGETEVALSIERVEEETPLSVIVGAHDGGAQKIVLVSAPEKHMAPSEAVLQSIYEMPQSEAKLLHLLVSGFQLKSAALEMNITESSARTYLKRIFSRTNTNSQPELVRRILMTPGLYREIAE